MAHGIQSKNSLGDLSMASVHKGAASETQMKAGGVYRVECFGPDGKLKWQEEFAPNIVVNQGLQDMNAKYFSGAAYTAAWYIGLINNTPTPVYVAGDTLASHAGWAEFTGYSGNRKAAVFGTATTADPSVIDNSGSPAQFAISATGTIAGAFLASAATGTSGVLFSEANFQAPGPRVVANGDTLNVTYTFSLYAV